MVSKLSADLGIRARAIYQEQLKNHLESTNPDDFVAIEPESGDFFLGKTLSEAVQAARGPSREFAVRPPRRTQFDCRTESDGPVNGGVDNSGRVIVSLLVWPTADADITRCLPDVRPDNIEGGNREKGDE
jgi:hypothetical protein